MANFCTKCGRALAEAARFCPSCGAPVPQAAQPPRQQPARQPAEPQKPQHDNIVQRQNTSAPVQTEPAPFSFAAHGASGEAVLGTLGGVNGSAADVIPGPGKVIGSGFKSLFTSIGSAFKSPKILIPALILAVIWLVLNILQACGIDPLPTRILSFLTFAKGGMSGGVIGAIGGVIGKGIFAGAVGALIGLLTRKKTGGGRSFADTLKCAFGVSSGTLWAYLTGIGAAMLLFLFISGGATKVAFMGGIAAAFLSARSVMNNGFVYRLVASFSSKGKNKAGAGAGGIMRGMSVGFAAAALIGLTGVNLILIIAGAALTVGGAVMMILQATGAVKIGKGEQKQ